MIERRKFGQDQYDLVGAFKTHESANRDIKNWLIMFNEFKITKSTNKYDKEPYKLWAGINYKKEWDEYKNRILNGVDGELRALIKDLNSAGQYTIESCSGHYKQPAMLWVVKKTHDPATFTRILKKHKMTNIRRRSQPSDGNWRDHMFFEFDLPKKV